MHLEKNQEFTVNIQSVTNLGEGITKLDGFTVFVPGAVTGDEAVIRLVKVKKNYGYGRLMQLLTPSPYRTEERCPIARRCGGCSLQHIRYEYQLELKNRYVADVLQRIGGVQHFTLPPCEGMQTPWRYRNKMVFPIGRDKQGQAVFGFYAKHSHDIIPCEDCLIGSTLSIQIARTVTDFMKEYHLQPYDEKTGAGGIRRVFIRTAHATGQVMAVISSRTEPEPYSTEMAERIRTLSPNIVSILWNVNPGANNLVLGEKTVRLWGKDTITDELCGNRFEISAHSFFQVNPIQTEKLYRKALEFAQLTGEESVVDLYCGIGTISLYAARHAKQVVGIEIVPQAIENARQNAAANGIQNAQFHCGPAEQWMPELKKQGYQADVVILDPPRKGSDPVTLDAICEMQPRRVVYVSCDSATLARDVAYLSQHGYVLQKVQTFDQFCHSTHVECVCLLTLCDR